MAVVVAASMVEAAVAVAAMVVAEAADIGKV